MTANAAGCFTTADRMLEELKPFAESVGEVSLDDVKLSEGIHQQVVGQKNNAYAEYSRKRIYLYSVFCKQSNNKRFLIIAHELGHAIDDAKGVLERLNFSPTGFSDPWDRRKAERSAEQWAKKIVEAYRKSY